MTSKFYKSIKILIAKFYVTISHLSITYLQGKNNAGSQEKAKKCAMINVVFQNPNIATAKGFI